jgi:hypothetical protein
MEPSAQHGYLVLGDISGYTSYLAGVELDHAQGVLTDLLETLVTSCKSLLTISKLEGDAVFGYVAEAQVTRGETLLEFVETTYAAFRDRLAVIQHNTTCTCNACRAIPTLDLKFIVHHGDYMLQNIVGIHELVGSDVNLVHRLLKNHVGEKTGWRAYALFSGASLERLVVPCDPRDLHPQTETYEHLGDIETYSLDLSKRYDELKAARRVVVADRDADLILDYDFPASAAVVWDYLADPARRDEWFPGTHWSAGDRPRGRTGPGAQNHCAHGKGTTSTEVVADWKPYDYSTMHQYFDKDKYWAVTYRLRPQPGAAGAAGSRGTHLHVTLQGVIGKLPRALARPIALGLLQMSGYKKVFDNMARTINQKLASAPADAAVPAEAPAMV